MAADAPKRKSFRRWFRFSLGTLFIVLTIGCLWLGWIVNRAQRQQRAVAMVKSLGGSVVYDLETMWIDGPPPDDSVPGPAWLRDRIGIDYFDDVVKLEIWNTYEYEPAADEQLAALRHLPKLRGLRLVHVPITDEGCRHLATLVALEDLNLIGSVQSADNNARAKSHRNFSPLLSTA